MEPSTDERTPLFTDPGVRLFSVLLIVLVGLLAWLVSAKVRSFAFAELMDDDINITLNPYLGRITASRVDFVFSDSSYVRRYIPLGWLGFCAVYQFGKLNPVYFHTAVLGWYVADVMLLGIVLLYVQRIFLLRNGAALDRWAVVCALIAAGWWAFNPMRVESIAWVSGLLYAQSGGFFLLGLICYFKSYLLPFSSRAHLSWLAGSWVGFAASLLSYPLILGFLGLLVVLDVAYSRQAPPSQFGIRIKRLLLEKMFFLPVVILVLVVTIRARVNGAEAWTPVPDLHSFPLVSRVMQCFYVLAYYLWRPFWPFSLSPIYSTLFEFNPWSWPFIASAVGVILAAVMAILLRRSRVWLLFLMLAFATQVAPFFGLTESPHYPSDRYACFSSVVLACGIAGVLTFIRGKAARWGTTAISLCVLGTMAWLCRKQEEIWRTPQALFQHSIDSLEEGELKESSRGRYALLDYLHGNGERAIEAVTARLRLHPSSPSLRKDITIMNGSYDLPSVKSGIHPLAQMHTHIGNQFIKRGEAVEALEQFHQALILDPDYYEAAYNSALLLASEGAPREALNELLWAQAHAPKGALSASSYTACLELIARSAKLTGDSALAGSITKKLSR